MVNNASTRAAAHTTSDDTVTARERILRAAETLFAERGIDAVSLREVTVDAGVNVAAIHYYFGSKEALLEEIFVSRAKPIAERRLALLEKVRRDKSGKPVLEEVLRAFLRPALEVGDEVGGEAFIRLRARLAFEPADLRRAILAKTFDASSREFLKALALALPALERDQLYWRFHFVLGAMTYTMAAPGRIESLSEGAMDTSDREAALEALVDFAMAGLRGVPKKAGAK